MLSKFIVDLQTRRDQFKAVEGQGLVEYSLIIALIAVVLVGALVGLRTEIEGVFGDISAGFSGGAATT